MAVHVMSPQTADLGSALERILKLEKANRSLAITLYVVLAVMLLLGAASLLKQQPSVVQAQAFSLVDAQGNVRAALANKDGHTVFTITDGDQKPRIALGLDPDGSANIGVRDNTGQQRLAMIVSGNGEPFFGVSDQQGKLRIVAGLSDGNPVMNMTNGQGASIWRAP